MRRIYLLLTFATFVFAAMSAKAQNGNGNNNSGGNSFSQLIKSSPADATLLFQYYAEPLFKGLGTGLNSGWNNTAKTKKLLHFDLRITANIAQVPAGDQSFDVTKIGLSNHLQVDPSSTTNIAPTFGGSKNVPTPLMDIKDNNGNTIGTFNMPNGVIKYIPAPDIQLTIGLVHNTDITIRTTPTINIGNNSGSIGEIGFGIKHDIIQDFAGKKPFPFDLAIALNYNRINYNAPLNVQPDDGIVPASGRQTFQINVFTVISAGQMCRSFSLKNYFSLRHSCQSVTKALIQVWAYWAIILLPHLQGFILLLQIPYKSTKPA